MKAKKRAVVIDYFPSSKDRNVLVKLQEWVESFGDDFTKNFEIEDLGLSVNLKVKTLEGTSYNVTSKDVIIRGVKGEYYPCKEDIFEATYEPVVGVDATVHQMD